METIEVKNISLKASADNLQLAVIYTVPAEGTEVKGILQLVHGMCEHKERYIPFMQYMSGNGWICVLHDHRGHGASVRYPNELGYFYDGGWKAMVEDVKVVTDWVRKAFPETRKLCMLGHSMGSMVVRTYLKDFDDQIDKLIVCGSPSKNPAAGIGIKLCTYIIKHYGGMSRPTLVQKMSFNSFNKRFKKEGSPNAWVCSNKEIVKAYDHDPLCQYQFTANGFFHLLNLMAETYDKIGWHMKQPALPIRFISGAEDPCMGNAKKFNQAVEFMRKVGYTNVSSHLYEGMRHEILNETDKAMVWKDVLDYVNA